MNTYTVTGTLPVRGHKPGEVFEEDIPERIAARLVSSGALSEGGELPKEEGDGPAKAGGRKKTSSAKKASAQSGGSQAPGGEAGGDGGEQGAGGGKNSDGGDGAGGETQPSA